MEKLMIVLTVVFVFSVSAFAQMGTGQGGMMGGGWGWGMGYGWGFGDHYRDSRYFRYRLYDEKKIKICNRHQQGGNGNGRSSVSRMRL